MSSIPFKWSAGLTISGADFNTVRLHAPASYIVFSSSGVYCAYAQDSDLTDYSGSSWGYVIGMALSGSRASNGSKIFIMAGTYPPISFYDPYNCEIIGEGNEKTIIQSTTDTPCIAFYRTATTPAGRSNLRIANLRLSGSGYANTSAHGIYLSGSWHFIVDNVTISGVRDGLHFVEGQWFEARDVLIDSDIGSVYNGVVGEVQGSNPGCLGYLDRVWVVRPLNDGFNFDLLNALMMNDCQVLEPVRYGFFAGPQNGGGSNVLVNCQFDMAQNTAVFLSGANDTHLVGCYIQGHIYDADATMGDSLHLRNCTGVTVNGGAIWGGKDLINVENSNRVTITGVDMLANRGSPLQVSQYSGIIISGSNYISISNSTIESLSDTTNIWSYGIRELGTNQQIQVCNTYIDTGFYGQTSGSIASYLNCNFDSRMKQNLYMRGMSLGQIFANNLKIRWEDSSGTERNVLYLGTDNKIWVGDTSRDIILNASGSNVNFTGSTIKDPNFIAATSATTIKQVLIINITGSTYYVPCYATYA